MCIRDRSCACAIENLWLAARAEGLGVGWVTLFPPDELAGLVGLPPGIETLGWLCVGWPDERPPSPGLERAGWSRRAPLEAVLVHERWDGIGPAAPASAVRAPDPVSYTHLDVYKRQQRSCRAYLPESSAAAGSAS